jgi:hypothetical protein
VRQLIVIDLGREAPTVIITNDHDLPTKTLIEHCARRMTIEQHLAEIIRAFCTDALSSTVNLNIDLDITLAVLAHALLAAFRTHLPGYASLTPDVIQRRFLETPSQITTTHNTITVRLERRAYPRPAQSSPTPTPPCPGGADASSASKPPNPLRSTTCVEIRVSVEPSCGRWRPLVRSQ